MVSFDVPFAHELTDETKLSAQSGVFQFSGGGIQHLELAGLDAGAVDPGNNGNFGFGQLVVGRNDQMSVVEVADIVDNGNRTGGNATIRVDTTNGNGSHTIAARLNLLTTWT